MNATHWDAYNTPAHVSAQAACRHLIHCAVDGQTRKGVSKAIDNARATGSLEVLPILLTQLSGPCVIPANTGEAP